MNIAATQESFPKLRRIREALDRVADSGDHKILISLFGSYEFGKNSIWLRLSYNGYYEVYFSRDSGCSDDQGLSISEFTATVEYPRTHEGFEEIISAINSDNIEKEFIAARVPKPEAPF